MEIDFKLLSDVNKVIDENPKEVELYRNGETKYIGFLMGKLVQITNEKDHKKTLRYLKNKLTLDN